MAFNPWQLLNFVVPGLGVLASHLTSNNSKPNESQGADSSKPKLPEGVSALPPNYANPEMAQSLLNFLFGMMPGGQLQGLPGYPGQLNPDLSQTYLPQMWDRAANFNPMSNNPGMQWMSDFLTGGGVKNPLDPFGLGADSDFIKFGAPVGEPFMRMQKIAQEGGTGGPGHQGLLQMQQFGGPKGPGTDAMTSLVNTGIVGPSGSMLQAMALGQANPASGFLAPFLKQMTYRPAEPTRRVA